MAQDFCKAFEFVWWQYSFFEVCLVKLGGMLCRCIWYCHIEGIQKKENTHTHILNVPGETLELMSHNSGKTTTIVRGVSL